MNYIVCVLWQEKIHPIRCLGRYRPVSGGDWKLLDKECNVWD